ncbi:MAG TPA: uroporphyrinogen decarboxylase [Chitinophagaceae bacterium]|nr:uroporphyrinogen decarboxylase [Chitinophagaceae bacterium]
MLKNDLLLKALKGEKVDRPPVWMMRQAGRYLPDYQKLRAKYSFFERCQNPELATEITLQPVEQIGVDAAIIFSDILVIPQAMGMEVQLIPGKGPLLPKPIKTAADTEILHIHDITDRLHYVFEALSLTKKTLDGQVPLIGFAGAPWTLFCYMIQGKGSKSFDEARAFLYKNPVLSHQIFDKITKATISYLKEQIKAGADCVQLFDSWSGMLSPAMFQQFSLHYNQKIITALSEYCPTILFAKGAWYGLEEMSRMPVNALGIDWKINPQLARKLTGNTITLQGNLDPAILLSSIPNIKNEAQKMIKSFGKERYIANLGHGILPNVPVDHARAFVDEVKSY